MESLHSNGHSGASAYACARSRLPKSHELRACECKLDSLVPRTRTDEANPVSSAILISKLQQRLSNAATSQFGREDRQGAFNKVKYRRRSRRGKKGSAGEQESFERYFIRSIDTMYVQHDFSFPTVATPLESFHRQHAYLYWCGSPAARTRSVRGVQSWR